VPCAFVELKEGALATEAEIIAFCRSQMSGFKTPKTVCSVRFPRHRPEKIQSHGCAIRWNSAKAISA